MGRLTFRAITGAGIYNDRGYEGETIMPSDIQKKIPEYAESIIKAFNKLAEYEDAEERRLSDEVKTVI